MSFVTTQPESLAAAGNRLQASARRWPRRMPLPLADHDSVIPAAADEVSALTATQFAAHAQLYQAVSEQAAALHELFVNTLGASAQSYAATEAANAIAAG